MRDRISPLAASVLLLLGCGHTHEALEAREASPARAARWSTEGARSAPPRDVVEPSMNAYAPKASRPRLSQTITLGVGRDNPYVPSAPRAPEVSAPPPNVVVQSTVLVPSVPAYVVPYGYGVPYGGYGRYATSADGGRGRGAYGSTPRWGSTGWEGPNRTALPGQTPGPAGNWPTVRSYGPAPMR